MRLIGILTAKRKPFTKGDEVRDSLVVDDILQDICPEPDEE